MKGDGQIRGRLRNVAACVLVTACAGATICTPSSAAIQPRRPCPVSVAAPNRASRGPCAPSHRARDLLSLGSGLVSAPLGAPTSVGPLTGPASSLGQGLAGVASTATTQLALGALQTWVSGGATFVLQETADVLTETTTPRLTSTWFSAVYWKVAGLAAMLTLPFLFAAAIQALLRSDLTLLLRAALGYLPLAMLAVAIAAPLTMLLLSASDELAAAVSSAAGHQSVNFLDQALAPLGSVGAASGSPFLLFLLGLFTVAGALILWIELLMREAAVYVIVLMLPLAFAAFVWPARRIWAIRSLEVLTALVLSKFAIVAVLSLGGVALGHSLHTSFAGMLAGVVLLVLGAFTPWALLRLVPLAELASGTAGALKGEARAGLHGLQQADAWATEAMHWTSLTGSMRHRLAQAESPGPANDAPASGSPLEAEPPESRPHGGAQVESTAAEQPSAEPSPPAEPSPAAERPAAAPEPRRWPVTNESGRLSLHPEDWPAGDAE